eukprot:1526829-Pyramimonas_sp.AAC.1
MRTSEEQEGQNFDSLAAFNSIAGRSGSTFPTSLVSQAAVGQCSAASECEEPPLSVKVRRKLLL